MKIALDVDGVLADHVGAVLRKLSEEYPSFDRTRESMTHWAEDLPSIDSDLKLEIERAESEPDFIRNMEPVDGAVEITSTLANRGHELIIVTARPESSLSATHEWLESVGIPHRQEESKFTNGEMKTPETAEVLIDDYPGHIESFTEDEKFAILFEQPWNRDQATELEESTQIFVAKSWDEIPELVTSIENTEKFVSQS